MLSEFHRSKRKDLSESDYEKIRSKLICVDQDRARENLMNEARTS